MGKIISGLPGLRKSGGIPLSTIRERVIGEPLLVSLGIKAKSCPTADLSIFCRAKRKTMASEPGLSLLEGTMHHRFLFPRTDSRGLSPSRQQLVLGRGITLGRSCWPGGWCWLCVPGSWASTAARAFHPEQTLLPSGKAQGSLLAAPWQFGGREAGLKERRE